MSGKPKERSFRPRQLLTIVIAVTALVAFCLFLCCNYVQSKLLESNKNSALNVAMLVAHNFSITDEEFEYMKTLTFNEMECDPINLRLSEVATGVDFTEPIISIYVVSPLSGSEIKYTLDYENAEFWDSTPGTPLDAMWLLNMAVDNGKAVFVERDDIYRYTVTTDELASGFETRTPFGSYSSDEWGKVISGHVPLYTVQGTFVGLLGVDMDIGVYQRDISQMVFVIILILSLAMLGIVAICIYIYRKYRHAKDAEIFLEFYSDLSHDMRTPMNGIIGMTELAKDEDDPHELHRMIENISDSGKYLLALINNTLDVGRARSGQLDLRLAPHSEREILSSVCGTLGTMARQHGLNFEVDLSADKFNGFIMCDELRLKQILTNLLSNSVKYTPPGGTVKLSVITNAVSEIHLIQTYSVSDTGVGMSAEFVKDKLFKPFSREINSMSDKNPSSGLGLSIVKQIVTAMNGDIEVKSTLGKGSVFSVSLTFPISAPPPESEPVQKRLPKGIRILLCEDNAINSEITTKLLTKAGCTVVAAEDGAKGVAEFIRSQNDKPYDVILMDIRMPNMGGLEAAQAIRRAENGSGRAVPIIAMSANAYPEDVEKSLSAGMNAHLSKPVQPQKLFAEILKFTEGR